MRKYKVIEFDEYLEDMQYQREWRCINRNGDLFTLVTGNEGVGKSKFILASCHNLDSEYNSDRIFYDWEKYKKLLEAALKGKIIANYDRPSLEKYNVGLDLDKYLLQDKPEDKISLEPGSCLHYDEAGVGFSNRESFTNVDQYKTLQTMRHLRCCNWWAAPKLRVIDVYAREERIKIFVWIDDMGTLEDPQRMAFIYSKPSLGRILTTPYWWTMFYLGTEQVIRRFPPDYAVFIPDLTKTKYIPKELDKAYEIRKSLYDALRMQQKDNGKGKKDEVDKIPKPGEAIEDFCQRSKMSIRYAKDKYRVFRLNYDGTPMG